MRHLVWGALLLAAAPPAFAQSVAQFRVAGVKLSPNKRQATISLAWTYNAGGCSGYTGKGVKLSIHKALPGRWDNKRGVSVGKIDMKSGRGISKVTFDLAKIKAKPGDKRVLVGKWTSGHMWGTDDTRPGGEFTIPGARKLGVTPKPRIKAKAKPKVTAKPRVKAKKPRKPAKPKVTPKATPHLTTTT